MGELSLDSEDLTAARQKGRPPLHLEIVSHCWRYSRLLTYQLSSLVLFPPRNIRVTMTVFYAEEDEQTVAVAQHFAGISISNVAWRLWPLETPQLLRRTIGRNLAALATAADLIWFTDADHLFRENCLDSLPSAIPGLGSALSAPLFYPETVLINREHQLGDRAIAMADGPPRVLDIVAEEFKPKRMNRAIGGIQICPGDVTRRTGYCRLELRHLRPALQWAPNLEDRAFRCALGTPGTPISLPNVFRLRHSQRGQDQPGLQL